MRGDFRGPAGAAIFYAVTLGLAVVIALSAGMIGEQSAMLTMLTPAIAVLVMMLVLTRDGWSRGGWTALGVTRAGFKGWWLAILAPAALLIASYGILIAFGQASLVVPEIARSAPDIAFAMGLSLAIGIALAFCEEVGWRGYMLPRVSGKSVVLGMLLVGFLHGVWHLPLMLMTPYYHAGGNLLIVVPMFLLTLTLAGVFYGYLFFWTRSVWPVAIAHGVYNFVWALGRDFLAPTSPETMEYYGGESGVLAIAGLIVVAIILIPRIRGMRTGDPSRLAVAQ